MKKFFFFLSTIALLGLASACVEQISSDNPNYNPEKGEVKTNFIINVATTAQTKATAAEVQTTTNNSFRGMDAMTLYMKKGYGQIYLDSPQYNLGEFSPIYEEENLTVAGAISSANSRRVYKMNIPTGVDNMVFYAKAKADENANNKTTYQVTPTKKTTFFKLEPIKANADFTTGSPATILEILNSFSSLITEWSGTDDVTLATAFKNYFTTSETLRQASGPAVLRTMQDLYKIVKSANEEGTTLAGKIKAAILVNFDADDNGVLTYQKDALLKFPFEDLGLPVGVAQVKCDWSTATPSVPTTFRWVNPSNTIADYTDPVANNAIDFKNIMFPAELCYWADSPIRVSNMEGVEEDENFYPKGDDNTANWAKWDDDNSWLAKYGWDAGKTTVDRDTRAVALKNNILYGTALAKFIVQMGESNHPKGNTIFLDNRQQLVPALSDQEITIDGTNGYFTVTGILIGGQPKVVGWNFVADANDTNKPTVSEGETYPDRTGVIYDHNFDYNGKIDASKSYYVPVFDNYVSGTQEVVYFALELENHADDFYGKDNIIYKEGKFYLTGKLQLPANSSITDLNTLATKGYRIPPVTDAGSMTVTPRIFVQDFVTQITATLGPNVLKNAYATIPDLRSIEMYFGLSVDLSWKAGASLSVEL